MSDRSKFLKNTLGRRLRKFHRSQNGSTAVMIALLAVPFLMAGTMALDYSNAVRVRSTLQVAADAGALAAATAIATGQNDKDKKSVALAHFLANLPAKLQADLVGGPQTAIDLPKKQVVVTVNAKINSLFGTLLQETLALKVSSTARVDNGTPICMLSLNPNASKALYLNGTADVVASGCAVQVNSNSAEAMVKNGSGLATAEKFCVRGKYEGTGYTPNPKTGCFKEKDPLAALMATGWAGVDKTCTVSTSTVIKADTTLDPGVYCGGFDIKKGIMTLKPGGVYVFRDGPLSISAQGGLKGAGVTILLTGDSSTRIVTQGGADIDISAQPSGPFAGIAIAMDASTNPDKENLITGGGYMSIDGIIYFPKQPLSIEGNGVIGEDTQQFAIIADTISVQGTGLLTIKITADSASFSQLPELPKSTEEVALIK